MIKMEPGLGRTFSNVCLSAKNESSKQKETVFFTFNDRQIFINVGTDLQKVCKEYDDSWYMGWSEIYGEREYTPKLLAEIDQQKKEQEKKERIRREELENKDKIQRQEVCSLVSGIEMELTDKEAWEKGRNANKDGYGNACFEYALDLAKLIQVELSKGIKFEDCIDYCESKLGFHGITGFQHGAVVSILSQCWKHGESIKGYYDKKYNRS